MKGNKKNPSTPIVMLLQTPGELGLYALWLTYTSCPSPSTRGAHCSPFRLTRDAAPGLCRLHPGRLGRCR